MARRRPDAAMEAWVAMTELLDNQLVGILGTCEGSLPYTSIVGYAVLNNYKAIAFATPMATRKFANIQANPQVSFLIDNRKNKADDFSSAIGVTAVGTVRQLCCEEHKQETAAYLARHPYLTDFVRAPTCAFCSIDVSKYIVVRRFQEVTEIDM